MKSPIFTIVESRRDDFLGGVPQCAAQMLGATYFNTLSTRTLFLKLENTNLIIDDKTYFTKDLETLLGGLTLLLTKVYNKLYGNLKRTLSIWRSPFCVLDSIAF